MAFDEDLDRDLARAQERLQALEDAVTDHHLLTRLEHENPAHPLLLGYKFFVGLMSAGVACILLLLAMPLISTEIAKIIAHTDARIGMPVPLALLLLSFCNGALGVSLRYGAILRAQHSPMLPDELKEHQALTAEVTRLASKKRLKERGVGA